MSCFVPQCLLYVLQVFYVLQTFYLSLYVLQMFYLFLYVLQMFYLSLYVLQMFCLSMSSRCFMSSYMSSRCLCLCTSFRGCTGNPVYVHAMSLVFRAAVPGFSLSGGEQTAQGQEDKQWGRQADMMRADRRTDSEDRQEDRHEGRR